MSVTTTMSTREVQQALKDIAWKKLAVDGLDGPKTRAALRAFQQGWTYRNLKVTGQLDLETADALRECVANGGKCSPHFRFREFTSKGNGDTRVHRELARALEKYRAAGGGKAVHIRSGYRDPAHNTKVGGARFGMHKHPDGLAADINPSMSVDDVTNLALFGGIGYQRATRMTVHVDMRQMAGAKNVTNGRADKPTTWPYG